MLFDEFWRATGEPPFDAFTSSAECYRLSVRTSLTPQHRVFRMHRTGNDDRRFVAHFFKFGASRSEASVSTHEIRLDEPLWTAFREVLSAARFWQLAPENGRGGLDGETYSLEASQAGRRHTVVRWSPSPIFSGGELFALVTDFMERMGELAVLECDSDIRGRYVPEYVPVRQVYPLGNLGD